MGTGTTTTEQHEQDHTKRWWHPPLPARGEDLPGLVRLVLVGPVVWVGGTATFLLLLMAAELVTGCGFMECDPSNQNVALGMVTMWAMGLVGAGSANLVVWVVSPPWARRVGWKGVAGVGTAAAVLLVGWELLW